MLRLILHAGFGALCLVAASLPFASNVAERSQVAFAGWPTEWESQPLREVPLSEREIRFNQNFPGRIAKFTDGRREFILRWVTEGTRQLHPSSDCFRGLGYSVHPEPAILDAQQARWSCFAATRGNLRLRVRERISDQLGAEWTDVSAWYWSVLLQQTSGPWLAVTIIEQHDSADART